MNLYHTLRCLVSVCLCVTDVGVAIPNLQVACKTITCVSAFTEMTILFFFEILQVWTLRCMLRERCHCMRITKVQRLIPVSAHGESAEPQEQSFQHSFCSLPRLSRRLSWSTKSTAPMKLPTLIARCDSGCLALCMPNNFVFLPLASAMARAHNGILRVA